MSEYEIPPQGMWEDLETPTPKERLREWIIGRARNTADASLALELLGNITAP